MPKVHPSGDIFSHIGKCFYFRDNMWDWGNRAPCSSIRAASIFQKKVKMNDTIQYASPSFLCSLSLETSCGGGEYTGFPSIWLVPFKLRNGFITSAPVAISEPPCWLSPVPNPRTAAASSTYCKYDTVSSLPRSLHGAVTVQPQELNRQALRNRLSAKDVNY